MADTKWLDPASWTLADWEDETKRPLYSHLWDTLKGAADERQAFTEYTHESGFNADKEFPNFNTDKSIFLSAGGSPKNAIKIRDAIYPRQCVDEDTIETSGTATSDADIPEDMTLSELLTGPLNYASGTLEHITDTDSGLQPALSLMSWVKQWYQVMDYPQYYNYKLDGRAAANADRFTEVDQQTIEVAIEYNYSPSTGTNPDQFKGCVAYLNGVDQYTTNDLNETTPFSTPQEVRDYAIGILNSALSSVSWASIKNSGASGGGGLVNYGCAMGEQTTYSKLFAGHDIYIKCEMTLRRVRFKMADDFRSTSPNKYTSVIKWNGFHKKGSDPSIPDGYLSPIAAASYDDFGTGDSDGGIEFTVLSPDLSDYYYLLDESTLDFDTWTALAIPAEPSSGSSNTNDQGGSYVLNSLTPNMTNYTTTDHSLYIAPNKDDGTAWEWYTPAPPP